MIPFTQYLRPNGRKVEVSIERPAEIEAAAEKIIGAGYTFECEQLSTGQISLTVTDDDEGDVDIEICSNDEAVPAAVDRMVTRFAATL